ncbi:gliding motility-associated C-terminal domain-containing protein [Flavobacterium swingsii]|uniref:Gliding motility-associated C-terminal domain-containing protein n=1 Tax=Flavobacterium swingsii TaxID=498292 RepID=A0A1I0V2I0_9FLAO|nr:choice-of-anchor L domain-containing protein [Flavobacterium swingsii]SFA70491.1 gliding motility-associated C-terminal domain-containing protein [Flavobacterium swingsii]
MKLRLQILVFSATLFFSGSMFAQYIQVTDNVTAQDLVQNTLINSSCALVSNFSATGGSFTGQQSYGSFVAGTSGFPFAKGVVLSTSRAVSTEGPNDNLLSENANDWFGDTDLEQALSISNTSNATILEFDFIPLASKISFDYLFASEEYHDTAPCRYSDGFGFLLKVVGSSAPYQNLALVPNTNTPVKVTSVHPDIPGACSAINETYFDSYNGINAPINFNGQTVVMTAKATVIPGTKYHIKLVIADETNPQYDSAIFLGGGTFQVGTDLGENKLIATKNPLCQGQIYVLDATESGTNTYKWFKNGTEIFGETNPTYQVSTAGIYSVEVSLGGTSCLAKGEVTIEYSPLPALSNQTLVQCDDNNDGSTIFNLTKLDNLIKNPNDTTLSAVTYYETIGGTAIANPSSHTSIPKIIFAEVSNSNNCKSVAQVTLQINNTVYLPYSLEKCDEVGDKDGITIFNLNTEITPNIAPGLVVEYYATRTNAITQNSPLLNNYPNIIPNNETIFARIVNGPDCNGIIEVNLKVNFLKPDNFEDKTIGLCPGSSVFLSVDPIFLNYAWNNGDADFETELFTAGNYSVEVTDANGCKATKKFIVNPSAPATNIDAVVDEFSDNNSILITYTDNGGDYEFSIDGQVYQDSPQFHNVLAGEYIISVRDKNGCLPTPSKIFFVLDYPKFFTPNGDGINDTWVIKNIKTKPNSTINIYDRFGKLLKQIDSNSAGWNGTYNGEKLPAADYWFVLTLFNNKTIKSHFALKR